MSAALPPGPKLLEVDQTAAVAVDAFEGGADLSRAEAHAQRVEQPRKLGFVDLAVTVAVEAVEAGTQRIARHGPRLRRFLAATNCLLLLGAASQDLPPLAASWLE